MADSKVVNNLFEYSGPLGTFSARIDLAFAMGLLDGNTHRELHLVRKIRNEFGHQHEPLSFATDAIKNRCTELNRVPRRSDDPRHLFTRTVMGLLAVIHFRLAHATQPDVPADNLTTENKQLIAEEVTRVEAYISGGVLEL